MKFVAVDEIPKKRAYSNVQAMLEEFNESSNRIVRCDWQGHYKTAIVCASSMRAAINRGRFNMNVFRRDNDVYVAKRFI